MNILLAIPFPVTEIGGVTTFVTRLQDGLNERGHNALLLVPGDADQVAPCDGGGRSNVYSAFLRPWYVRGAVLKGLVAFLGYLPLTLFDLWTFLRRHRIDVVDPAFLLVPKESPMIARAIETMFYTSAVRGTHRALTEMGFIAAETVHFDELVSLGSFAKARESGRLRIEGKDYVVKDGDVVEFRFNV